jgi:hypothetical protein
MYAFGISWFWSACSLRFERTSPWYLCCDCKTLQFTCATT